jgi:L-ascorbate metabolism protein UlaG (beta-lactamase superfamily)
MRITLDCVPAAPPVGITTADIARADYVFIGHSHFDHLWGAERIAAQTGATVVGSYETVRLLHDSDLVPASQLIAVAGGEPVEVSPNVRCGSFRVSTLVSGRGWRGRLARPVWATLGSRVRRDGRANRV